MEPFLNANIQPSVIKDDLGKRICKDSQKSYETLELPTKNLINPSNNTFPGFGNAEKNKKELYNYIINKRLKFEDKSKLSRMYDSQ